MKTSKIIFTSLLAAIAIIILAGFIEVRIHGKRYGTDMVVKNQIIPSFKVLKIDNSDIHLVYGDSTFFAVTTPKDSVASVIEYKMNNDTLTVSNIRFSDNNRVSVKIHSSDSLKNILVVNSDLIIERYGSKNLTLGIDKGNVSFNHREQFNFHTLDINAKNHSNIYSDELTTENLNIFLQKSEANLEIIAQKLNGILTDSSTFSTRQSNDITLKKDGTSRLIIYE